MKKTCFFLSVILCVLLALGSGCASHPQNNPSVPDSSGEGLVTEESTLNSAVESSSEIQDEVSNLTTSPSDSPNPPATNPPESSSQPVAESTDLESNHTETEPQELRPYDYISQVISEGKAIFDQTGFVADGYFNGESLVSKPVSDSLRMNPSKYYISTKFGLCAYDPTGLMISFTSDHDTLDLPESPLYSQEELRQIGEKFLSERVDLSLYPIFSFADKDFDSCYSFVYYREVKGYPSFEYARVRVGYDGTLLDFNLQRKGVFDSIDENTIPQIDEEKLLKKLDEMAKADPNRKWSEVPYSVVKPWYLAILSDGTFAMQIEIHSTENSRSNAIYDVPLE